MSVPVRTSRHFEEIERKTNVFFRDRKKKLFQRGRKKINVFFQRDRKKNTSLQPVPTIKCESISTHMNEILKYSDQYFTSLE